jgi:hypothetical protein
MRREEQIGNYGHICRREEKIGNYGYICRREEKTYLFFSPAYVTVITYPV